MNLAIQSAIQNRDAATLARIATRTEQKATTNDQARSLFNAVFKQLRTLFPAANLTTKTQDEADEMRRQWVMAFAEAGITTIEQVSAGMRIARNQEKPFMPSPGQFVAWCKQGCATTLGLPDETELYQLVMAYCRYRSDYESAEDYPWKNNIHYWLVTDLVFGMRSGNWTDSELRKEASLALDKMAKRLESGEQIPTPIKRIAKKNVIPLPREKALEKIRELRELHGLRGRNG